MPLVLSHAHSLMRVEDHLIHSLGEVLVYFVDVLLRVPIHFSIELLPSHQRMMGHPRVWWSISEFE